MIDSSASSTRPMVLLAIVMTLVLFTAWTIRDWAALSLLRLPDNDDMMRLAEVRDWLGGQGFNDLMQAITGSVGVAIFGQLMANGAMSGGSLFGTESGPASTYANVFMVGGIIVLGAMVIFICSMKMIYSRSRVAEDES